MKMILALSFLFTLNSCVSTPISGKKALLLVPESQEVAMGEKAFREILAKEKKTRNSALARRVSEVGRRIAAASGKSSYRWEFVTIESKTPNAFCLPGGKVAIYTGIVKYAQNEAGLATIIGHEIAHALARHAGQRLSQNMLLGTGLQALAGSPLGASTRGQSVMAALGVGANLGVVLPFSRKHETEADDIGLILMARAGYDPREAPRFWKRFSQAAGGKKPPEFLSTHPSDHKRAQNLTSKLDNALKIYYQAPVKKGIGKAL